MKKKINVKNIKRDRDEKRRLQLNKLQKKGNQTNEGNFARPDGSAQFLKVGRDGVAVRTPISKRMLAIILALVFVLTVIPAAVFVGLKGRAEEEEIEQLGPVSMAVIANGRTFTTAEVPAGIISENLDAISFEAALPNGCVYEKTLLVGEDGTETPVVSVGSLGEKVYYSIDNGSSIGTALNPETQSLKLVYSGNYKVTLITSEGGDANTNAKEQNNELFIRGGTDLVVQATPNRDYRVGQITYKVGDSDAKAASVSNGSATISNLSIYDDVIVSVNFVPISSYAVRDARYTSNSVYYPELNGIDNHGGTTQSTGNNGKEGVDNVPRGGTAEFYIYSEANTAGNEWLLNMISINGVDIAYPFGEGNSKPTTLREYQDGNSVVTVKLEDLDAQLLWKGDRKLIGSKTRSIYKVSVTNVHENLDVAYHFKEKDSREIIMKDLFGIAETGAAEEKRGDNVYVIAETRNYLLDKEANNVYEAYYNKKYGTFGASWYPSANLYLYRVKPGFNPYSVGETPGNLRAVYINDSTGASSEVSGQDALSGESSSDIPVNVIKAASNTITAEIEAELEAWNDYPAIKQLVGNLNEAIRNWDSFIRFWGPSSELQYNKDVAYRKADGIGNPNETLLLQSIAEEERDSSKKWYAIALKQREEKNQQLYIRATPYEYHLELDLDGGSLTDSRYTSIDANNLREAGEPHTLAAGDTYALLPASEPTKEINGEKYVFEGWQLYKDNEAVENHIYQANTQFPINANTIAYSSGNERENANHVFSFKAEWKKADEAEQTKATVDIYVQVPESKKDEADVELEVETGKYYRHVVDNAVENQVAGAEAVLLDRHDPENAEFYEIREDSVVAIEELEHLGITGNIPSENKFVVHWDIVQADLNVKKEVVGRLKTNEFPITITLTPPDDYPFTLAETRSFMSLSNNEALGNIRIEDGKLVYTKNFVNGADATLFSAPGGWTYTVEESVSGNEFETYISDGTEELEGRTFSRILSTEDTNIVVRNQRKYDDPNLETDKWLTKTDTGYDLTMEAYATARSITEETTNTTPLDIVLVIDQSGSMANKDMNPTFAPTEKNSWTAEEAAGSDITYYYKVGEGDDAVYYPVQSDVGPLYTPVNTKIKKVLGTGHDNIGVGIYTPHYSIPTSYYSRDNNTMHKVYGITAGRLGRYEAYLFYYNNENDAQAEWKNTFTTGTWDKSYLTRDSKWNNLVRQNKIAYVNNNTYVYCWPFFGYDVINDNVTGLYKKTSTAAPNHLFYIDNLGEKHYIGNMSIEEDDIAYDDILYQVSNGTKRVDALKDAVSAFAEEVASNANENDIEHRIAVVGFAGNAMPGISHAEGDYNYSGYNYGYDYVNTGMYVNGTFYNYEEISGYERISNDNSKNSSLMDTTSHYYIDYNGAKVPIVYLQGAWWRIDQANGRYYSFGSVDSRTVYKPIYKNGGLNDKYDEAFVSVTDNGEVNPVLETTINDFASYGATYTSYGVSMANNIFDANPSNDHKKIVVVFTDGEPGKYGYDNAIAGEALADAQQLKDEDVKVYTVGLFVGNPSEEVDAFMSNMSSEGTTTKTNVSSEQMDPDKTYWYYDSDKNKTYAVSTTHDGESTQGWWTENTPTKRVYHADDDSDETIGNDQKYAFYRNRNCTGSESISDIDISRSYYIDTDPSWTSTNAVEIKYQYKWYNSENEIVSLNEHQFFEISNTSSGPDNNYYFHSDNPAGLNQIFENISQTITTTYNTVEFDDQNAKLKDTVTADFDLPGTEDELKAITKVEIFDVTGYDDNGKPVFAETGHHDVTNQFQDKIHWFINSDGTKTVEVDGFNYAENFVSKDRAAESNKGKKLVVTVQGLEPNENKTGGTYDSNTDDSGLYRKQTEDSDEKFIDAFPIPSISRYKYKLEVGEEDKDATFNIDFQFKGYAEDGTPTALTGDLDFGGITFSSEDGIANWGNQVANGESIIFEQILTTENNSGVQHGDSIPDNYTISTNVEGKVSDEYKYTMKLNDNDPKDFDEYYDMPKADATINISSTTKKYPVTVIKQVRPKEGDPDYTDKSKKFDIVITLYDKDGETAAPAGMYDGIEFETSGGKTTATISLSHDEREMFNIPYGFFISINEDDSARIPYEDSYWDGATDTDVTENAEDDAIYPSTKIGEGAVGKDIIVLNTLEAPDIASGVLDENNPFGIILAILAGICAIAAGVTVFYSKKRKKETEA